MTALIFLAQLHGASAEAEIVSWVAPMDSDPESPDPGIPRWLIALGMAYLAVLHALAWATVRRLYARRTTSSDDMDVDHNDLTTPLLPPAASGPAPAATQVPVWGSHDTTTVPKSTAPVPGQVYIVPPMVKAPPYQGVPPTALAQTPRGKTLAFLLEKFTCTDLKAMLRERGFPQCGLKHDLALRFLTSESRASDRQIAFMAELVKKNHRLLVHPGMLNSVQEACNWIDDARGPRREVAGLPVA